MVYFGLDLFLRAVAVASCLASWQYGDASPMTNWAVMLGGWVYLTVSAAAFPTRGQSVGYLALSENPCALYARLQPPQPLCTVLLLPSTPPYTRAASLSTLHSCQPLHPCFSSAPVHPCLLSTPLHPHPCSSLNP